MRVGWTHRWWLEIGPNRADSLVADCVQSFLSPFYFTVIVQMGGRQNGQNKKRESQRQKERERESHKRERERVIKNKQQKEKKEGEMRVKQSRRLLPGRLSCEHICVWRFEQPPMCLLRSHDCLSFLFSLPLKTRCPSSHSSHHGQKRKGYSNRHWEQELLRAVLLALEHFMSKFRNEGLAIRTFF